MSDKLVKESYPINDLLCLRNQNVLNFLDFSKSSNYDFTKSNKTKLVDISVELSNNERERIAFYLGDNPDIIAEEFCDYHRINNNLRVAFKRHFINKTNQALYNFYNNLVDKPQRNEVDYEMKIEDEEKIPEICHEENKITNPMKNFWINSNQITYNDNTKLFNQEYNSLRKNMENKFDQNSNIYKHSFHYKKSILEKTKHSPCKKEMKGNKIIHKFLPNIKNDIKLFPKTPKSKMNDNCLVK